MALPGLPTTTPGVLYRAASEGWKHRAREGRGGGREFHISAMPAETRAAILRQAADVAPAIIPETAGLPALVAPATVHLADWQRRTMDARAAILAEVRRLAELGSTRAAILEIVQRAQAGTLHPQLQSLVPHANARGGKSGSRTLSRSSIYGWLSAAENGVTSLAPWAPPPADAVPAWAEPLLRLLRRPSKTKLSQAMRDLPGALPQGIALPSYGAARRFIASMSIVDRERGRRGPNALLAVQAFKRRSTDHQLPLDVVTADGHSFKSDIAHPVHGKPFRPEVCALMDTACRYVFGWSAGLAESSHVVMDAIRRGVEQLGQFAIFYTDNGSGFVANAMTDEVVGFLSRLSATPENSTPGRAQSRGKIERLQATLWQPLERALPTYAGRDMDREARRKVVKLVERDLRLHGTSRLLPSWSDFLDLIAARVADYNARPHRSLPKIRDAVTGALRHQSPAEALEAHRAKGWEPLMPAPGVMADLFRPYEMRVTRRGEVQLPWGRYFAHELVPHGETRVRVGYDITDGSRVWVRTAEDGRLICIAGRNGNVVPEMPASAIEHAREKRATGRLRRIEEHAAEVRAELRGPSLIEHDPQVPAFTLSAGFDVMHAETVRRIETPIAPAAIELNDEDVWFLRAQRLQAGQADGATLSPTDADWLEHAVTRPWFTVRATAEQTRAAFMARTAIPPVETAPIRKSA
jgi:putative transposase